MFGKKFVDSTGKMPVLLKKVCHLLAGLFRACLTGCSRDKPDFPHFGCPLFIMVPLSRRLPIVVLPQMHHFMSEGGEHFSWFPRGKVDWIKCNFIGYFFRVR